jgi:hypothetical protein
MERAIKARLLSQLGITCTLACRRIPVRRVDAQPHAPNWKIELDRLPIEAHPHLHEAYSHLSRSMRLD